MNTKLTGVEVMFRPSIRYGEPHPDNKTAEIPGFWFRVDGVDRRAMDRCSLGMLGGFVTREQFDWLAERFGTPKLAEVDRG